MRRYGDNVTPDEAFEEKSANEKFEYSRVFYGGCGFGAGPFDRARKTQSRVPFDIFSLLGSLRKKARKNQE
jgi:hypothetical protein